MAGGYFLHANQDAVIKFVDEKVGKVVQALLVALLLAGLTIGGQQWYIGHLNDKHEAYKSKVIAATVKAEQAAIATTKAIANIGEQRVTVYRDRIKTIEASTNVQIDPNGVPDCRRA